MAVFTSDFVKRKSVWRWYKGEAATITTTGIGSESVWTWYKGEAATITATGIGSGTTEIVEGEPA